MALTRKFLTALGIDAEKIDEIIEAHTSTVNALKEERDKYKGDAEKLTDVQKQLDDATKQLDSVKDDGYKEKYSDLKKEFDDYKIEQKNKETKEKIRSAYKALLTENNVDEKRIDTVMRVTDLDSVKIGEDGKLVDSDKLTESIKKEWADFIVVRSGDDTDNPPKGDDDGQDLGKLSMEDYIAARRKK